MEYQRLSENPSAWMLAGAGLATSRLDASYYSPEFLDVALKLQTMDVPVLPFRKLCEKLNCGSTPKLVEYGESGTPLIRTTNVRPYSYNSTDVQRVPGLDISQSSNIAILPEDVLYTMSGSIGYAAVYPQCGEIASCSNTIARGRILHGSGHDPYYVAAFLNSSLGYAQSRRLVSGGVLAHVMPNSVKELLIATPDPATQRAIGNKVRKAERLRELAATGRKNANAKIDRLFGNLPVESEFPPFGWRPSPAIGLDRIDAWFHRPFYIELASHLEGVAGLRAIGSVCDLLATPAKLMSWSQKTFDYFEIGGIDAATGEATSSTLAVQNAPSRAKYLVEAGDVLVSTVRPNLRSVGQVDPDRDKKGVATSGFCVLHPPTAEIGAYIRACLVHDAGVHQLMRWNTGGAYPAIDRDVPGRVLVPFDETEAQDLGTELLSGLRGIREAAQLVDLAREDIESLVDGTLDEPTLIAENEAIEKWLAGNPSPHDKERV